MEERLAPGEHERPHVQVVFLDQAQPGHKAGQFRTGNAQGTVRAGRDLANLRFNIAGDERGLRTDP